MADKMQGQTVINALIIPLSSSSAPPRPTPGPTPPGGTQPPVVDNTLPGELPHPEHPIYWPLPPYAPVDPDYGVPETPKPPTGGSPPRPDHTLPGDLPHPEHPIVLPPGNGGWSPVYIDNTLPGDLPHPEHPIVIPPDMPAPPEIGISGTIKFKAIWTPANGWQTIGIVIPGDKPIPTPSKKK